MSDDEGKILAAIEGEAISAIEELGMEADQAGNMQAYVVDGDIVFAGGSSNFVYKLLSGDQGPIPAGRLVENSCYEPIEISYTDPIERPHDDNIDRAWAGYMLLACLDFST
jgi:hypothetical protein